MIQIKLVSPNGSPKAMVATTDVVSGREFQLFSSLLGVMALGSIPSQEFDKAGRQMSVLIPPEQLVARAKEIVLLAMDVAAKHNWTVDCQDIEELYAEPSNQIGY